MALLVAEEGFRDRLKQGITGYMCLSCAHHSTALDAYGGCGNCGSPQHLRPVYTKEAYHDQTKAAKAARAFKHWDMKFNAQSFESQMGRPLTPDQLLALLRKFVPSTVMRESWNFHANRKLMGIYIRDDEQKDAEFASLVEQKERLKYVCACEATMMPEWDILPLNPDGSPQVQIRGWRSVLGIFYRSGYMPFLPDDGNRLSWHQVKLSPFKKE